MPKPAKWSVKGAKFAVDADGTLTASIPVLDNGVLAGTADFTVTADRALEVLWTNQPGAAGLTGFSAWSKEA